MDCNGHLETILCIVIKDDEPMSRLIRKSLAQRLDDPTAGRMPRDIEVQDAFPVVADDEEAVEHIEGKRRDGEEVHRRDNFTVIAQKGLPALRGLWIPGCSSHPTGNSGLQHQAATTAKSANDGSAPEPKQVKHGSQVITDGILGYVLMLLNSKVDGIVTRDSGESVEHVFCFILK